jgi:hypothetical protein
VAAGQVRDHASALQGRAQSTLGQAMERAQTFAGTIRDQAETRVVETGTAAGDLASEAPQDANVATGAQGGA